eukprot:SAG11_NODE_1020_length_6158_cov_4.836772_2_plen_657_part_00
MDSSSIITVCVRLPPSGRVVTTEASPAERVSDLAARLLKNHPAAAADGCGVDQARLIFGGRALEPEALLGSYNVQQESQLMLQLRAVPAPQAVDPWETARASVARAKLCDFHDFEKVGGRDITPAAAGIGGYTQHGVCSYVYKARRRGAGSTSSPLAIKVMLNMDPRMHQTVAIARTFSAEQDLLSNIHRLPPHPNIMTVLRAFTDDASALPDWDFESDVVQPRTLMLVMPFMPKDLQNVLGACRRAGEEFDEARAARIGAQVGRALAHLEGCEIVHRDVKLDNVLIDAVGTAEERAVLTDFGMCFDCRKNQVEGFRVAMFYDGFCRGGAPIAMAPEVSLPEPGPGVYIYYGKNDAWALGIMLHALLSPAGQGPFEDMEHPRTYSDDGYRAPTGRALVPSLAGALAGLLRLDPAQRLGSATAAQLLEAGGEEIVAQEALEAERMVSERTRMEAAVAEVEARVRRRHAADEAVAAAGQSLRDAEAAMQLAQSAASAAIAVARAAEAATAEAQVRVNAAKHTAREAAAATAAAPLLMQAAEAGEAEFAAALGEQLSFEAQRVLMGQTVVADNAEQREPGPEQAQGGALSPALVASLWSAAALGVADKEMPAGTRIWVEGRGDGPHAETCLASNLVRVLSLCRGSESSRCLSLSLPLLS